MALQGDFSTLELADLLQSFEQHGRSGTLSVVGDQGEAQLYLKDGRLALLAAPDRPPLMEVLVGAGLIGAEELEAARKKRRRSRKTLGQVLVAMGLVEHEQLVGIATARLLTEACELVAEAGRAFRFDEGGVPRGVFDPEERALELGLPIGPLLLESARRCDHWRMIRERVPSDSAHYVVQRQPRPGAGGECEELAAQLWARLDGSRSVREALAPFAHLRFEAFRLLAELVESGGAHLAGPDDLARLADQLEPTEPQRARAVLRRGLEASPQHAGLLAGFARLAEVDGDRGGAAEALKLLAHLTLEEGRREEARELLARAAALDPRDAFICERRLALAIEDGRIERALEHGRQLAALHSEPGLHQRAAEVWRRLLGLEPDRFELHRELARSLFAAGETEQALGLLERRGAAHLAAERYAEARRNFGEVQALDPTREGIEERLAEIDSGALAARRERRRRLRARVLLAAATCALGLGALVETAGRLAWAEADGRIAERRLVEQGHYDRAAELLEAVRRDHPLCSASWLDLPARIEALRARVAPATVAPIEAPPLDPEEALRATGTGAVPPR